MRVSANLKVFKIKESNGFEPDAAVVLYHLHTRGDGCPFGGVEGGINRVVEDAIWPVIAGEVVDSKKIPFLTTVT